MPQQNYTQIEQSIAERSDFEGNSCNGYTTDSNEYVIMSYDTEIARISTMYQIISFDDSYYSSTTSRLQNIIKRTYKEALRRYIKRISN